MLYSKKVTNKYGSEQIEFYLTQGDTADLKAVPKNSEGSIVDLLSITKCLFKLSDTNYKEVFSKEFTKGEDGFSLRLESSDTASIPVDTYIYEVEYTFIDGSVNTPNQTSFTILDQIVD